MKIIISGTREFNDYKFIKQKIDFITKNIKDLTIISGNCKGVDSLAEFYAKKNNHDLVVFPANWNKYGKKAGPIRNSKMVEYADGLICFWNGKSRGTKDIIQKAENKGIKIKIINI